MYELKNLLKIFVYMNLWTHLHNFSCMKSASATEGVMSKMWCDLFNTFMH